VELLSQQHTAGARVENPVRLFDQLKTSHGQPGLLDVVPFDAGPRLTTFRGGAVHCTRPPDTESFVSSSHFVAVGLAPCAGLLAGYGGDKPTKFDMSVGAIDISPAHVDSQWSWSSTLEYMQIGFETGSLLALAEQELDRGSLDLRPIRLGTVDEKALYLAQMLKAELSERAAPNELYVDSLITVFGIHLLRTYAGRGRPQRPARGGLSAVKARRVRDFLQANFWRKLSVADLASLCDLSPGHFIHAFTRTFGQSPYQVLLHLRLREAERLLLQGDLPITEVAHLSGFSSQSHLTNTMRKYKNLTPAQLRGVK
jgi:AraC family transcriptional regulator